MSVVHRRFQNERRAKLHTRQDCCRQESWRSVTPIQPHKADSGATRTSPGRSQKMKQYASTQRRTSLRVNTDVNRVQGKEALILAEAWPTLANKRHRERKRGTQGRFWRVCLCVRGARPNRAARHRGSPPAGSSPPPRPRIPPLRRPRRPRRPRAAGQEGRRGRARRDAGPARDGARPVPAPPPRRRGAGPAARLPACGPRSPVFPIR